MYIACRSPTGMDGGDSCLAGFAFGNPKNAIRALGESGQQTKHEQASYLVTHCFHQSLHCFSPSELNHAAIFRRVDVLNMRQWAGAVLSARPFFLLKRNSRMIGLLQSPERFAEHLVGTLWMCFPKC